MPQLAPRDETDADIERIANPQTPVESSERLDPELGLSELIEMLEFSGGFVTVT